MEGYKIVRYIPIMEGVDLTYEGVIQQEVLIKKKYPDHHVEITRGTIRDPKE